MNKLLQNKLIVVLIHLGMGVLLLSKNFATLFANLIFILAVILVVYTKNRNNTALIWSMYLVSFEVLFRMSEGLIFHESIKYEVIILLSIGMLVEYTKKPFSLLYTLYLLLLTIGIAFSQIPADASPRKTILFNLSGPFVLGISAIYSYKRKISRQTIYKILQTGSLPVISMLSYLFFKTPDLKEIVFRAGSNFATSGGFGPNQVATALGFGLFTIAIMILIRKRLSGWLVIDIILLIYVTYRGLLTFSRGGLFTAFIALLFFSIFYISSKKSKIYNTVKYITISLFMGISVWLYTANITGGMLVNRYAGKNTRGDIKDDVTSGRIKIFETDLSFFYEHPISGIGVGSAKYKRNELDENVTGASHNEVGRLLSEHGLIGVFILLFLLSYPLYHFFKLDYYNKAFSIAFYLLWFLTINHSAMRIAFPGFIYGLSLLTIIKDE